MKTGVCEECNASYVPERADDRGICKECETRLDRDRNFLKENHY